MTIGKIQEFDISNGNWSVYVERLDMYFMANDIKDNIKLATMIAVMGDAAYELLNTLSSPKKPSQLSYKEAVDLLQEHLQPEPSFLAERYRFRQRRQMADESIAEYVAELKKLTRYCDFADTLEDNLRDQLVCGINSEVIRQRLFAEKQIDYKKAVQLAITIEAAERDAVAVEQRQDSRSQPDRGAEVGVQQLSYGCTVCGFDGHSASQCKHRKAVCSFCNNVGHLRRMCRKKAMVEQSEHQQRRGMFAGEARGAGRGAMRGNGRGSGRGASRGSGRRYYNASASANWLHEDGSLGSQASELGEGEGPLGANGTDAGASAAPDQQYKYESCEEDEEPVFQMGLSAYKPA